MRIGRIWRATMLLIVALGGIGLLAMGCGSGRASCTCPTIYAPVCGANGHTYGNSCEADCVGVRVAQQGTCDADGGAGGTGGASPGSGGRGTGGASGGGSGGASECRQASSCCVTNADCPGTQTCVGATCAPGGTTSGVCKPRPTVAGQCWQDAHCTAPAVCLNPRVCPCGAACLVADEPGTCN